MEQQRTDHAPPHSASRNRGMRVRALILSVACGSMRGCGHWVKSEGAAVSELPRAKSICQESVRRQGKRYGTYSSRSSLDANSVDVWGFVDPDVYTRCMSGLGWTKQ